MKNIINLVGNKYGRLTVISQSEDRKIYKNGDMRVLWNCLCECGNTITAIGKNLKNGDRSNCGCGNKHGLSKSREYEIWRAMRARCNNPNSIHYDRYGGRGIRVCDEWNRSFISFYNDMGKSPTDEHSIDRIDNDLWYSKDNCKWSTKVEQSNNRENNIIIEFRGESKTLAEWARYCGVTYNTLHGKYYRDSLNLNDYIK